MSFSVFKSVCLNLLVLFCHMPSNGWCGNTVASEAGNRITGVEKQFADLIARCAPTVHPETMAAVISAESRGHQFAIADAGPVNLPWAQRKNLVQSFYFGTSELAVAKATELIAIGHTVSLGLAQVNDRNLRGLGLTVKDVFEPCTNVAAGGRILTDFYQRAAAKFGPGTQALQASISAYNSGDWVRGLNDGYVGLVYKQVGLPLTLRNGSVTASSKPIGMRVPVIRTPESRPATNERPFVMSSSVFVASEE